VYSHSLQHKEVLISGQDSHFFVFFWALCVTLGKS
jgi:hypothetical protein